jgi:hypothetical protein
VDDIAMGKLDGLANLVIRGLSQPVEIRPKLRVY